MSQSPFLDQLLSSVYENAVNRNSTWGLPVKLVDEPVQFNFILDELEIFKKNYQFFEPLSLGRLSANLGDWKMRASLTQSYFAKYTEQINEAEIEEIYLRHFKNFFMLKSDELAQNLVDAGMEVICGVLGLPQNIPWPNELQHRMRDLLNQQQAIAWGYGSAEQFLANKTGLQELFNEVEELWTQNPQMNIFLDALKERSGSPSFNSTAELIQLFHAATETISSMVMWLIYCLLKYKNQRLYLQNKNDKDSKVLFIKEALRLYPSIPFVTRICTRDTDFNGAIYKAGDTVILSLIGLHSNPAYWSHAQDFDPQRPEFREKSLDKRAYIPFLSGSRSCVGMRLAHQELFIALTIMLDCIEFADFNEPLKMAYGLTSKPSNNLENYLTLRKV
jgi:cytochrome P450